MYSFRFLTDAQLQENIDAWVKVEQLTDVESVRNHATECIDALEREQVVRAEYDTITRDEVQGFISVHAACFDSNLDAREVITNMGMGLKRYDAFERYRTGTGRQG